MKKIVDIALELISTSKDKSTSTKDIAKNIDNEKLLEEKPEQLESQILTDLMIDGRFLLVDNKWHLKEEYTMDEILQEQYRSLNDYEILVEEETDITQEESNREIEMAISLDNQDQMESDDAFSITGKDLNE